MRKTKIKKSNFEDNPELFLNFLIELRTYYKKWIKGLVLIPEGFLYYQYNRNLLHVGLCEIAKYMKYRNLISYLDFVYFEDYIENIHIDQEDFYDYNGQLLPYFKDSHYDDWEDWKYDMMAMWHWPPEDTKSRLKWLDNEIKTRQQLWQNKN